MQAAAMLTPTTAVSSAMKHQFIGHWVGCHQAAQTTLPDGTLLHLKGYFMNWNSVGRINHILEPSVPVLRNEFGVVSANTTRLVIAPGTLERKNANASAPLFCIRQLSSSRRYFTLPNTTFEMS